MTGQTISHYKILSKLGEGGMGEVWEAEGLRLGRHVALKFLASHLVSDAETHKRFEREAKAAASLSHPNICTVHEIDEADGKAFLAMEFVKGEALDARIETGPMPLNEALDLGRQIAEGLQEAHAAGVVHRDIKPGNILVTPEGRAKILDFGLALLTEGSKLTKLDTTVGTVAYMSPEQAQGPEVDHRTDIWALGVVLYEMVAGVRPFKGQYDQALLYEIVNEQPEPLTGIRAGVPMELEIFVAKCLAKDAADRYDSAAELAKDLRTLAEKLKSGRSTILRTTNLTAGVPATMTAAHTLYPAEALPADAILMKRTSRRALQVVAAVATLALVVLGVIDFTRAPPDLPEKLVRRFSFSTEGLANGSISPDGKYIAYAAEIGGRSSLWLRSLATETSRELPGTEGGSGVFWSPDSASIGFQVGSELRRLSIDGGSPLALCELPARGIIFLGGTWRPDGERIVFSSGLRLYEIAARGGQPQLLFDPAESPRSSCVLPHFLPTGDGPPALVYSAASGPSDRWVAVLNLETGELRELGPGSGPVYSRDGYLIHGAANRVEPGLWALPFSRETLKPTGDPFPISTVGFAATVSHDGTLAYQDQAGNGAIQTLVWLSRTGELLEAVGQPQLYIAQPALSPDGQRVAVMSAESGIGDIWVHDLTRSTKTRLTFEDQVEVDAAWSPSGREIAYRLGGVPNRIMLRDADGSGEAVALVEAADVIVSYPDWSRDGRYLVYHALDPETQSDIRFIELGTDGDGGDPVAFLASPANERYPKFSPGGRFLAYTSDESGRNEIYVRPFPGGAGKWQASMNGGRLPRWRSDGRELYYVESSTLMAVSVSTESAFSLGRPQPLFEAPVVLASVGSDFADVASAGYDVSADGQRFLTIAPVEGADAAPSKIRVVQNWYEEFRERE